MCSDEVYVVFEKSDADHLFKRFIHKEINHCYLIVPDGDTLISINKGIGGIEAYIINAVNNISKDSIIIKHKPSKDKRGYTMINTCVGHIKQYIGLSNVLIQTPYQLLKELSK